MNARRRLLVALVVATWIVGSCSDGRRDGITWYKAFPAFPGYDWTVLPQAALTNRCAAPVDACMDRNWATETCNVFSVYSEAEARKYKPAGTFATTTLFAHEVWDDQASPTLGHCGGFDHKESARE